VRCEVKHIKDMQLLGAMAPPGGGRNPFSQRISACFSTVNVTQPNDAQLRRIFTTLLSTKLGEFDDDVRPLSEPIVAATVEVYRTVSRELLPTPSKSHYLFNTRDLAKIVLGVMQVCVCVCVCLCVTRRCLQVRQSRAPHRSVCAPTSCTTSAGKQGLCGQQGGPAAALGARGLPRHRRPHVGPGGCCLAAQAAGRPADRQLWHQLWRALRGLQG
jgi:hypothetical protein